MDRYWVGGTGTWDGTNTANWSATSGGAGGASVPTAADNVFFDANSNVGTGAFTVTMANTPRVCNDFTASGLDGAMTLSGVTIGLTVSGSLTFPTTNFTRSYTGTTTFSATTTGKTITTNGVSFGSGILFDGVGGGWLLGSALTTATTQITTLTNGTLDLQSYTLSTGRFSSTNSNTRTIAFGTGQISCTGTATVWTTATTTNLTTTGTQVVNVTSTGSTAITVSTGSLSEANSISYNLTGGTYSVAFNGTPSVRNLNFTGFAGTLSAINTTNVYGNLTISTGMTVSASTNALIFAGTSGTQQITTNGKTLDFPVTFNGVGGTFRLEDALTMGSTRTATLTNGTLDLNGKTMTVGTRFTTATGTKNLTFNGGTLVCPDANTTSFNNAQPTGFTTTAGTGTGTISMTAATAKTFVGGGSTYNCTLNQGGIGTLTVSGNNTFSNLTNTVNLTSVLFTGGTTNIFTNFNLTGALLNLVTLGSTNTTQATLQKGSTWFMGANSTNGGNNTGLTFTAGGGIDYLNVSYINGTVVGTGYTITASSGTYTSTGQNATILRTKLIEANYGVYLATGQSATIARNRQIDAGTGSYSINGQTIDISYVVPITEQVSRGGLPPKKVKTVIKKNQRDEIAALVREAFDKMDGTAVPEKVIQKVQKDIQKQIKQIDMSQYDLAITNLNTLLLQAKIQIYEYESELDDEESLLMLI